jgi:hypothetical protein
MSELRHFDTTALSLLFVRGTAVESKKDKPLALAAFLVKKADWCSPLHSLRERPQTHDA